MAVQENNVIKQIIVMRKDLNMRKGKMVAQGSHASISFLTRRLNPNLSTSSCLTEEQIEWLKESFTKICVSVDSEEELMDIYNSAEAAKLEVHLITDNGATEFNGVPTKTCLAIGPHRSSKIDPITKELKLL